MADLFKNLRNRLGNSTPSEAILPLYEVPRSLAPTALGIHPIQIMVQPQTPQYQNESGSVDNQDVSDDLSEVIVEQPPPTAPQPPPPEDLTPPDPCVNQNESARPGARLTHIEEFLDTSKSFAAAPSNGRMEPTVAAQSRTTLTCKFLRESIFWSFVISAILANIKTSKYAYLQFLNHRILATFMEFGNFSMILVAAISFLVFFWIKEQALIKFRDSLQRRKEEDPYNPTSDTIVKWTVRILHAVSVFTASCAQLETGRPLDEWSFEAVMENNAYFFGMALYWWKWPNDDLKAANDYVKDNISENASGTRTAYALSNIVIGFCAVLVLSLLKDMLNCLALTMYLESKRSAELCQMKYDDDEVVDEATAVGQVRTVLSLIDVSYHGNNSFRGEIKVVIIMDVFIFTFLLQEHLSDTFYLFYVIMLTISAIKSLVFFLLSVMTNVYGRRCQETITRISRDYEVLEVDGRRVRLILLVDNLDNHPISIGRGPFLINEAFLLAFLTTIGTFFSITAQASGKAGP